MKRNLQKGSAHLIIFIVLCAALVGSVGFIFYQNFMQPKAADNNSVVSNKTDDTSKTAIDTLDDATTADVENTNKTIPTVAPAVVVNELVTAYLSYINSSHTASFSSSLLTDAFQTVVNNPSGEIIVVDPILLVQNMPNGFTVGSATVSGESASVPVTLNFSEPYNITYNLVIVNNEWKIDGVVERFKN